MKKNKELIQKKSFFEPINKVREKLKWFDPFTYVDLYVMPKVNPNKNKFVSNIVYIVFAFIFAYALFFLLGVLLATKNPLVIVLSGSMEPIMFRGDIIMLQGLSFEQINAPQIDLDRNLRNSFLSSFAEVQCIGVNNSIKTELASCNEFIKLFQERKIDSNQFVAKKISFNNGEEIAVTTKGDVVVYFSNSLNRPIIHRVVAKIKARDGLFLLTKGDSTQNPLLDQQTEISPLPVNAKEIDGKAILTIPLLGHVKLIFFDDLPRIIQSFFFKFSSGI